MIRLSIFASISAALLLVASTAAAQEAVFEDLGAMPPDLVETPETGLGITATVGGGAEGFIEENARDATDIGGAWTVRIGFLSRFVLTPELSYIGSAQGLTVPGLDADTVLVSNGGEGTLRLNIFSGGFQPYIFGGVGFRHYNLLDTDQNSSGLPNQDTLGLIPTGVGFTVRLGRFILDARGTFRWTWDDNMLTDPVDSGVGMSTWTGELRAGFEI